MPIQWDDAPNGVVWDESPAGVQWDDEKPKGRVYQANEPLDKFHPLQEAGRAAMENLKGGITAAGDLVASIPGFIGSLPYAAYETATNGPKAGLETMGSISHEMNPLSEDFAYGKLPGVEVLSPDRETGAYANVNKPFEMMSQGIGNITGDTAYMLGASPEMVEQSGAAGELGFGALSAATMAKGLTKPYEAYKARQADALRAQDLLQQKMAGEAEYGSWEAYAQERQAYHEAEQALDNAIIKYPKDLQAPQLGGGGRAARIEDQVGKREQGKFANQMAYDEEMRKTAEGYQDQEPVRVPVGTEEPGYTPKAKEEPYVTEAEATRLYKKNPFERTAEDRIKLKAYEESLRQAESPDVSDLTNPAWETRTGFGLEPSDLPENIHQLANAAMHREIMRRAQEEHLLDDEGRLVDDEAQRRYAEILDEERRQNYTHYTDALLASSPEGWETVKKYGQLEATRGNSDILTQRDPYGNPGTAPKDVSSNGLNSLHRTYNGDLFQYQATPADHITGRAGPTVRGMMETIAKTSKSPFYKEVAKLLLEDKEWNPRLQWSPEVWSGGKQWGGLFSSGAYKIILKSNRMGDETSLIHEAMHSRTQAAIGLFGRNPEKFAKFKPAITHLQDVLQQAKDAWTLNHPEDKAPYGLTDLHELISEAFSNPNFQDFLRTVKYRGTGYTHLWNKFLEAVKSILGLNDTTLLDEALKAGAELTQIATKEDRLSYSDLWKNGGLRGANPYDKTNPDHPANWMDSGMYGLEYSLDDFKKDLQAKGIKLSNAQMKAMYEAQKPQPTKNIAHPDAKAMETIKQIPGLEDIQRQYADKRSWEEVLPEIQKSKDVGLTKANVTAKIIQGKFTAAEHPLWSWTSSKIHWIKQDALMRANEKLHGKDRKNPQPGTYNHQWKLLTGKERDQLNQVGWEFNNKDFAVSVNDLQNFARKQFGQPLSQRQIQAYQDRVRINKEVLKDINKVLVDNNKEPINELPNYWSPNVFNGPFLTKFIDPTTGDTVKIHSSYLRPNLKKMQAINPKMKVETIEIGNKGNLDFDQIEWILRQLHKEMRDPAARAIAEGLRRQGFAKHGLKRRGVEGGEGSGAGMQNLRKYEETSEQYIRGAYDYIANRSLDSLYNQILDEKSIDNQPHAKGYALESIDTARGGSHQAFEALSKVLSNIFRGAINISTAGKINLPERALKDFIRVNTKIGTSLLLGFGNLTNIAAQFLQAPTYMPPKLLAMSAEAGRNPALVIKAMAKAYASLKDWDSHPDIQKLKEVGALDPTFKYDWSTYASESDPRFKAKLSDHLTGISLLSWLESNVVRKPASLMFLNMLRELGYKGDDIHYVAKEMTDHYMVSTKWFEKPHMFSRTGLIGQVTSPLQSFTTTWAGMLREYSRLAAKGALEGSVAKSLPLTAFMAGNLLTAGLLGMVGVKEWDFLANWLNKNFGYNIPTGTEYIMSHTRNPKLRFGVLSDAVGMNVGATFNAPTLTGSFGLPLTNAYNAARAVGRGAQWVGSKMGLNPAPTSTEAREALKGVTPRFSPIPGVNWGDIEKKFTPEGKPYEDSAGNAGPVTRDSFDWLARRLGTYSTREAVEKNRNYTMKQESAARSARLSTAMNHIVDQILQDPEAAKPVVAEQITRLVKQDKFSNDDIRNGLKRELLSKIIEADQRQMGSGKSTKQKLLIQLYNQLQ